MVLTQGELSFEICTGSRNPSPRHLRHVKLMRPMLHKSMLRLVPGRWQHAQAIISRLRHRKAQCASQSQYAFYTTTNQRVALFLLACRE
ncbi:hypothetical protein E2C01_061978 [Portunus trituberculatus]|uniref:Uncharacterized protein n=1 Tax=Portunus trituberculatus TaxID=210409 RepID=A0A5B7HGS7_PORTR|nr:hypothetical protein [Portunus trituberculatus]